ncbi:MAG: hypothetical protein ACYC9Y_01350 [Candidatus Methylomirabilia bacterium]
MNQKKILLLENVAAQAAGLREHLSRAGFQVTISRYEADGLKRLVEWGPDLVLVSTAHPAGDLVEYCRRVRALAPACRLIIAASLNGDRLFREHPGLQALVDGVLLRPVSPDEIAAMLASAPVAPPALAAARAVDPAPAALRAEFQRQLDARFLEVEELKRRLEAATGRPGSAPDLDLARLQTENAQLRQVVEEARKKAALTLATEQLKRSEVEVKLDNLLRMKEDFEFRVQNEIEDRTREIERVSGELQGLRERSEKATRENAALGVELERVLAEKAQIEGRLHTLETRGLELERATASEAEQRIASLEEELSRQRALEAQGQVVLADTAAKLAVVEESLARERAARQESEPLLAQVQALREQADLEKALTAARAAHAEDERLVQECRDEATARTQELLERAASAERSNQQLKAACAALEERLAASEAARITVAAEAEAVVEQIGARGAALAAELEQERAVRADAEQRAHDLNARLETAERLAAEAATLRAKAEDLGVEIQRLNAPGTEALSDAAVQETERLGRELAEAGARARELSTERDRLKGLLEEGQLAFDRELLVERDKAAAAVREFEVLRSQQEQRIGEQKEELGRSAEGFEKAVRDLEQSERRVAALNGELAAERAARGEDEQRRAAGREERSGREQAEWERQVATLRESLAAADEERRRQVRELEEKLAARAVSEAGSSQVQAELQRIQELLEQVIVRARTEAVDFARRDAELSVRLQAALDERRLLQERFDRANAEATERERRSSTLLQSAIDRGPAWRAEPDNLPALVPLDPDPGSHSGSRPGSGSGKPRQRLVLAGLAVAALAVLLAVFGLRGTTPPADPERQEVAPRPQPTASPGAAAPPPAVWDRWTRSDTSGGVLVQATLRSKQELRAEVEADSARGINDEEAAAELARRLETFRFDTTYYVTVYLKNLAPGYPAYLDNLPGHFRLRDSSGSEVPAFLPPGHEKDSRVYSFGAGAPAGLIYEASVSLGFDRAGLTPSAGYLQLVVSDVGAASRRVLTWELE